MSRLSKVFHGFAENFRAAQFRNALSRMSDRQLDDIGISRYDIPRRATEMARMR